MKNFHDAIRWAGRVGALALLAGSLSPAAAQSTAFTYSGRLTGNGALASGSYEMQFSLYDAINGNIVAGPLAPIPVDVANGLFTVRIDFGAGVFTGAARWLDVAVRPAGGGNFVPLTPRQEVTSSPYSIRSQSAATADGGGGGGGSVWSVNGGNAYYNSGNVGIGTASPLERLTISGVSSFNTGLKLTGSASGGTGLALENTSSGGHKFDLLSGGAGDGIGAGAFGIYDETIGSYRFAISSGGNVGIGTATPSTKLTVRTVSSPFSGYGFEHTDGTIRLATYLDAGYGAWLGTRSAHNLNLFVNDGLPSVTIDTGGATTFTPIGGYGSATFGTPNGESGLSIKSANRADVRFNGSSLKLVAASGVGPPPGENGIAITTAGNVGVGTTSPLAKLDVRGTTRTCVLTIVGGCDLAEPFPMKESEIEKGSVVVIDEEHAGQLKLSTQAYDKRVAGIVSGANGINPGISLQQEGTLEGGQHVALTGRVYVQADASTGAITPGDLLTTSATPGHAMKVADHAKAQGAILGKAMSALKDGKGMVLVLVTLQ